MLFEMKNSHPTVKLIYVLLCQLLLLENMTAYILKSSLDVTQDEYIPPKYSPPGPCEDIRKRYGNQYLNHRGGKTEASVF